jgi:hypothetical protein
VDERARVPGGAAGAGLRLASCRARFSGVAAQRHAEHRLRSRG